MVAEFLDLKTKLSRERNEASVTDLLVASLLKLALAEITVIVPYEPETGSDFDLLIVDTQLSDAIQYRLQAKKLSNYKVKDWRHRSYRELDHPNGTGIQSRTLIRSSASEKVKTIPLYIFYNDQGTCDLSSGLVEGVSLADGVTISRLVKDLVAARPKRLPIKRIGNLIDLFFPFSTILCAPGASQSELLISPDRSRKAVTEALARTRNQWSEGVRDKDVPRIEWRESPERLAPPAKMRLPDRAPRREIEPSDYRFDAPTLKRKATEGVLPQVVENALNRRGEGGIVRAPVRRTKVVMRV